MELTESEKKEIRIALLIYASLLKKGQQRVPEEVQSAYTKLNGIKYGEKENKIKGMSLFMEVLKRQELIEIEESIF